MLPLNNGVANIVEFKKNGESDLCPFNCGDNSSGETEHSRYRFDEKNIMYINSLNGFEKKIELISMTESQMALGQYIGGDVYEFSYIKVSRVLPLCFLYKEESGKDKLKRTPFQKTDLTPSPWIPDNPNIAKYVGRWADDKGIVQVEINKDANGRFKVFHENNESWNHLYNNVSWSGVELHFQSFAYSNKKNYLNIHTIKQVVE